MKWYVLTVLQFVFYLLYMKSFFAPQHAKGGLNSYTNAKTQAILCIRQSLRYPYI